MHINFLIELKKYPPLQKQKKKQQQQKKNPKNSVHIQMNT